MFQGHHCCRKFPSKALIATRANWQLEGNQVRTANRAFPKKGISLIYQREGVRRRKAFSQNRRSKSRPSTTRNQVPECRNIISFVISSQHLFKTLLLFPAWFWFYFVVYHLSCFGLFDHKVTGSEDTKSGKVRRCWLGGKGKLRDGRRESK